MHRCTCSCRSPCQGSANSCRTLRRPPKARSASKSENIEGELICRSAPVAELHGPYRRGHQPECRQPSLSDRGDQLDERWQLSLSYQPVEHRCQESRGYGERGIACAGTRFTECTANVMFMG